MAGTCFQESGLVGVKAVVTDIITKMLANGFTKLYPSTAFNAETDTKVVLKAGAVVDPLHADQPWAIKFEWTNPASTDGICDVYVATPIQFDAEGNHSLYKVNVEDPNTTEALGILGAKNKDYLGGEGNSPSSIENYPNMGINRDRVAKTFLHRTHIEKAEVASYPLSYTMTIAERGIALCVWDETKEELGTNNSWFVVQRPVKHDTGAYDKVATKICDKNPVHCIYGIAGVKESKPWLQEDYVKTFVGYPSEVVYAATTMTPQPGVIDTFLNALSVGSSTQFNVDIPYDGGLNTNVPVALKSETTSNTVLASASVVDFVKDGDVLYTNDDKVVGVVHQIAADGRSFTLRAGTFTAATATTIETMSVTYPATTANARVALNYASDCYVNRTKSYIRWGGTEDTYRYVPKAETHTLRRFIVRERDINAPYPTLGFVKDGILATTATQQGYDYSEFGQCFGVPADKHTLDYAAVINSKQQVAISEGNKYVITFPNGLNTSRYSYTHELDLLAYTSADVVSAGTEVPIQVYGEATPRVYIALSSNGPNNTGMRILLLKSGGGVNPA